MTYLDWAATTPPDRSILLEALESSMDGYGNPSSPHDAGKTAKKLLEAARVSLHDAIFSASGRKAPSGNLVFTGSGTEADQLVLLSLIRRMRLENATGAACQEKPHIIVSAIEHAALYAQAEVMARMGFSVSFIKPDSDGIIAPQRVTDELRPSTKLVAVMAVNNETGAIQDIAAIGRAIETASAARKIPPPLFHVDCVQAFGKIPLDLAASGATSAAFSAHKIQGPKGIGALWIRKTFDPLATGGGQELGMRSGTENVFGAMAFARCAAKAVSSFDGRFADACILEKQLLEGLNGIQSACVLPRSRVGRDARWSPWIVSAAFPGIAGEVLVRGLSDAGICVSTGSACSHAGRTKGRRILDAMGLPEELSFSAIRISIGPGSTREDIAAFLGTADDLYRRLKT